MYSEETIEQIREMCDPAPGQVAVFLDTPETMTESGLYIPVEKVDYKTGVVFAVGAATDEFKHEYEVGSRAFMSDYAGREISIKVNGEKVSFELVSAQDILCTLKADAKVEGVVANESLVAS